MDEKTKQKLLNIVKQNYEDIADDFSATRNYVWPELKKIIMSFVETRQCLASTMQIFDLGCGNGRLAKLFAEQNLHYMGIEQSVKLSKLARQKLADLKITGNIITGDILNLSSITNEKIDLILCAAVLPHIPSSELRQQLLRQIKNHLAEDGVLIITVWNLRARWKYKKLIWQNNFKKLLGFHKVDFGDIIFSGFQQKSPRYYHAFTENELQTLLLQSGFNIRQFYADKNNIYAVCYI